MSEKSAPLKHASAFRCERRILSFDGGGIRGVFSLQIAARIEHMLREARGCPDLVLADVFDMFAGTSTGAIIATCLAWGMPVREVMRMYMETGPSMFMRARWWRRIHARYRADRIATVLRRIFTEDDGTAATLGSRRLRAMLMVVMRNATTGSAWPLTNNPAAKFNDPALADCNLHIPLWKLLRASTAAPTFFPPEEITLGPRTFAFVDGGITPYNNPAFIAVLTAILPQYGMNWRAGCDRLQLISIGTGGGRVQLARKPIARLHLIDHLVYMPPALLSSISEQQDIMCRVLGRCLHGDSIDLEIGDLRASSLLSPAEQKFTYVRYDAPVLKEFAMDDIAHMQEMCDRGEEYARLNVKLEHFLQ